MATMLVLGGSADAPWTVNRKSVLAVNAPSETVTVMVVLPDLSAGAVIFTVRFEPPPPNVIWLTNAGFAAAAEIVRLAAELSESPTKKGTAAVACPGETTCAGIPEIEGGVFAGEKFTSFELMLSNPFES